MLKRGLYSLCCVVLLVVLQPQRVEAKVVSPGTPTTSVPSSLVDPLGTLPAPANPLPVPQYLLPIEIAGANGLQSWSFDLLFDDSVVNLVDGGGLYYSVYQAEFNATDPTVSEITSSGFPFSGLLEGIAGFSSGVSGDGVLVYVLFELSADEKIEDAGFQVNNARVQQVPEPGTIALLAAGLLFLAARRARLTQT